MDGFLNYEELPGLLGPKAAPQARPPKARTPDPQEEQRGFWQRVAEIFSGPMDPRLSPAQQKQAREQALLKAGIGMMATQGNLGQQLAAGVGIGQEEYTKRAGAARQEQQAAELQKLIGGGAVDESTLRAMLAHAISTGNIDVARVLSEVLKSGAGRSQAEKWEDIVVRDPTTGEPKIALMNPATGEIKPTEYGAVNKVGGGSPQLKQVMNEDGTISYEIFDPTTYTWIKTGKRTGTLNEKSQIAGFMMPQVTRVMGVVDQFTTAPGRLMDIVGKKNWGEVTPELYQQLYVAGRVLGDAYLRITSGAAIKEEEVVMFMTTFLPSPGDSPGTLILKRGLRDDLYRSMQVLSKGVYAELPPVEGVSDGIPDIVDRPTAGSKEEQEKADGIFRNATGRGGNQ